MPCRYEDVSEPVKDALTEDLQSSSYEDTPSPPLELIRPYNDGISEDHTVVSDGGPDVNQENTDGDFLISDSLPSSDPAQEVPQDRPQRPQRRRQPPYYLKDYVLS